MRQADRRASGRRCPARARRSQRSLVTVKDATGTMPTASAHAAAPPELGDQVGGGVGGAGVVPQQRRRGPPRRRRRGRPCRAAGPPTATAATSSSPPASASAACSAVHHASGSTSVPSGCAPRPCRTNSPVSASRTTTLHDWVEESTPATSVTRPTVRSSTTLPVSSPHLLVGRADLADDALDNRNIDSYRDPHISWSRREPPQGSRTSDGECDRATRGDVPRSPTSRSPSSRTDQRTRDWIMWPLPASPGSPISGISTSTGRLRWRDASAAPTVICSSALACR